MPTWAKIIPYSAAHTYVAQTWEYPHPLGMNSKTAIIDTELRKADRTVGVNCNIFSNISSGTVRLLQGMFTNEKRRYNLNNQDKSLLRSTFHFKK